MNGRDLGDFLRHRREALRPGEAGLPSGAGRRRTPGLRREEVAWLAGISTNYYERLEQARAPRPSPQVLNSLGRALRLSEAERLHLARLAGQAPAAFGGAQLQQLRDVWAALDPSLTTGGQESPPKPASRASPRRGSRT